MPPFSRLIRFIAKDGAQYFGDAILPSGVTDIAKATKARLITGDVLGTHQVTEQVAEVESLLSPLSRSQVGTVRCLGLNYAKHAAESNMPLPSYPILFYKPITSLSGPTAPIPVSKMAQSVPGLDYECELVIIIGIRGSNIARSSALKHVLGYAVGNDVSHREWQLKRGGGQWSLGKGFDAWAPWGPGIVSPQALGAKGAKGASGLEIWTKLNGAEVQRSDTGDLIFGVEEAVSFLSQGTTLMPGDVIFTGTPAGVGMGCDPPLWLKDGDVVEVGLEGVGTCTNKVVFDKLKSRL